MVVLVLMALLASLATTSVRAVVLRQRLARAAEVVEQFDRALRRSARYQRRNVAGAIDRRRGRFSVAESAERTSVFDLPRQVSIDAIRFGTRRSSAIGETLVASGDGATASYAIRLQCGDASRWVLMVGGSGQVVHDLNQSSIDSILGTR